MYNICVVGGGAAGLFAACRAAGLGAAVTVFERNEKAGKKLYITGKGRCNVTNLCGVPEFLRSVYGNSKFLLSAINSFTPADTVAFFEGLGVPLKTERGDRVFPVSDKASDIIRALQVSAAANGVRMVFNERVLSIKRALGAVSPEGEHGANGFKVTTERGVYSFDRVILATGGKSYPATGSTGDGYVFAETLGHKIVPPVPALVPILLSKPDPLLQGLSLKNIRADIISAGSGKVLFSEFGEMLFTDKGVSGPVILSLSGRIARDLKDKILSVDLKPALDFEQLDKRLLRDFSENINKQYKNSLAELLPKSLIPHVIIRSGINPEIPLNKVTREERQRLLNLLKGLTFQISGTGGFAEAVITVGGAELSEINPKTMESKLVPGLYFCGEIIDAAAETGGFNLQIAWSTAFAAGSAVGA
ncbi:MAG: NAD(P)/FAD-dependent oxidoreductase [Clostridiaceae bacterium]|nr:NAD(P)/FAD-dependent oxidoreductase [Clostridiaceae bacterium]